MLDLQVSQQLQRRLEETRNKVKIDSIIIRKAKNEIAEDKEKQQQRRINKQQLYSSLKSDYDKYNSEKVLSK